MRKITKAGWRIIHDGFDGEAPTGDVHAFWAWASHQGDGFRLAAAAILSMANGYQDDDDLPELTVSIADLQDRHWRRLATLLDDQRNAMLGELFGGFRIYFVG